MAFNRQNCLCQALLVVVRGGLLLCFVAFVIVIDGGN